MSKYTNVKVHSSELESRIILDDVDSEDSINPRATLNQVYIDEYRDSIIDYLSNGENFSDVWKQKPEAVETDKDGVYLLISGYHTITALKKALEDIQANPEKEVEKGGLKYKDLEVDFDVIIRVYPTGKFHYRDTARYLASFSNVHGQPLTQNEKQQAAYNALSTMNLTSDEDDGKYRPFVNDRKLAAIIGVSKSTVWNVRKRLSDERFGVKTEKSEIPESPTEDASTTVENLAASVNKSTVEVVNDATGNTDGGDKKDEKTIADNLPAEPAAEPKQSANSLQNDSDKEFRIAMNSALKLNADILSMAYSTTSAIIVTRREKDATLNSEDEDMLACQDSVWSLLLTVLDRLATENDERG